MLNTTASSILIPLAVGLLFFLGCTNQDEAVNSSGATAATTQGSEARTQTFHHAVDDGSVDLDMRKALDGDAEAAERIVVWLGTSRSKDHVERDEWIRIGAENGSPGLMALYAQLLHEQGGVRQCKRALFWLSRATEVNPSMSQHNEVLRREIEADVRCAKA